MLAFVIQQGEFILTTTQTVSAANDFLETQYGMILYNSTGFASFNAFLSPVLYLF